MKVQVGKNKNFNGICVVVIGAQSWLLLVFRRKGTRPLKLRERERYREREGERE